MSAYDKTSLISKVLYRNLIRPAQRFDKISALLSRSLPPHTAASARRLTAHYRTSFANEFSRGDNFAGISAYQHVRNSFKRNSWISSLTEISACLDQGFRGLRFLRGACEHLESLYIACTSWKKLVNDESRKSNVDITLGAFVIAKAINKNADIAYAVNSLRHINQFVHKQLKGITMDSPQQKLENIAKVFFDDLGFHTVFIDDVQFFDRNSIDKILISRRASPLMLSVILTSIGKNFGLELETIYHPDTVLLQIKGTDSFLKLTESFSDGCNDDDGDDEDGIMSIIIDQDDIEENLDSLKRRTFDLAKAKMIEEQKPWRLLSKKNFCDHDSLYAGEDKRETFWSPLKRPSDIYKKLLMELTEVNREWDDEKDTLFWRTQLITLTEATSACYKEPFDSSMFSK